MQCSKHAWPPSPLVPLTSSEESRPLAPGASDALSRKGAAFSPRIRARGGDTAPSRGGIGSCGEDEEEELPWSAREVELLNALVVAFVPELGAPKFVARAL